MRVITYFEDQVDEVAEIIEREFTVDREKSTDKRGALEADRFGYLSLHYVLSLGEDRTRLVEYKTYAGIQFEIQIRSILQHAWAEIEHDLGYKSKAQVPALIRRRFSRLAGLLEIADAEFSSIRRDLSEYAGELDSAIAAGVSAGVDRDSVLAFISKSELITTLDGKIAAGTGVVLSPLQPEYAGWRADELQQAGFDDIQQVAELLRTEGEKIAAFAIDWILAPSTEDEVPLESDDFDAAADRWLRLPRGVVLYYLHLHLSLESGRWREQVGRADHSYERWQAMKQVHDKHFAPG